MSGQHLANAAFWQRRSAVRTYANRSLTPAEVMIFIRYRLAFGGRVLELGCGAGRLTGYIAELGGVVLGTDVAPAMVDYCRRVYPRATFRVADLREPDGFDDGAYDAILAGNNLLDILEDADRRRVLARIGRALVPGGLLVMSSHNRAFAPRIPHPLAAAADAGVLRALLRAPRVPLWMWNRQKLRRHVRQEAGYAVLNDEAHDYRLVHYYITRDAQAEQFAETGFELLECLDHDGRSVAPGEQAADSSELYYVARSGD